MHRDEETRHPLDDVRPAVATDLKAEFLGPNKGFTSEFMAEIFQRLALHFPRI